RGREVAREVEVLGNLELKRRSPRVVCRKQAQREARQLGGNVRGAAQPCVTGGHPELLRDRDVRPGRRKAEMARSLLRIAREIGDRAVRLAPRSCRGGGVHRGREQWVDELDPSV